MMILMFKNISYVIRSLGKGLTCFVCWRKSNKWLEKEHDELSEGFTKSMFQQVLHHETCVVFCSYVERLKSD